MEAVIKKLSEIEIAAKKIMEEASGQLDVLKRQMDQRTAEFDAQVERETEEKLDKLRQSLQEQTDAALAKLKEETKNALSSLENYYDEHHEQLSDAIFQKIIRM